MAYADRPNDVRQRQLADLSQTTTPSGVGGSGPVTGPSSAALTQATGGDQFVNFNDYINANQPATTQFAGTLGSQLGVGDVQRAVQSAKDTQSQAIQQGTLSIDQDALNQVLANPQVTDTSGYRNLSAILGGQGYTGPTDTAALNDAQSQVNALQDKTGALSDASALKALFLQHPNKGTTQGGSTLDAALALGTPGSREQLQGLQATATGLNADLAAARAAAQNQISAAQNLAATRQQELQAAGQQARNQLEAENQAELQQRQAEENANQAALRTELQQGDLSRLRQLVPSLDTTQLSDLIGKVGAQDLTPFVTAPTRRFTTGDVLTPAEQTRLQGLTSTFKLTPDTFIQQASDPTSVEFAALDAVNNLLSKMPPPPAAAPQLVGAAPAPVEPAPSAPVTEVPTMSTQPVSSSAYIEPAPIAPAPVVEVPTMSAQPVPSSAYIEPASTPVATAPIVAELPAPVMNLPVSTSTVEQPTVGIEPVRFAPAPEPVVPTPAPAPVVEQPTVRTSPVKFNPNRRLAL